MLRYPYDWPKSPPQEKGVDVALATDLVSLTLRGECDIVVVASADSDILPAIEEVQIRSDVRVEVAAWQGARRRRRQRLSVPGWNVWCHWLGRDDYERVRDDTDYRVGRA